MNRRMTFTCLLLTLFLSIALIPIEVAQAAAIAVNTLTDEDVANSSCSLREAITAANNNAAYHGCSAGSGTDTISFTVTGTINLSS